MLVERVGRQGQNIEPTTNLSITSWRSSGDTNERGLSLFLRQRRLWGNSQPANADKCRRLMIGITMGAPRTVRRRDARKRKYLPSLSADAKSMANALQEAKENSNRQPDYYTMIFRLDRLVVRAPLPGIDYGNKIRGAPCPKFRKEVLVFGFSLT